jgi:hypothetical protein
LADRLPLTAREVTPAPACRIDHLHAGLAHVAAQRFVQRLRRNVEALHGSVVAAALCASTDGAALARPAASNAMHRRDGAARGPDDGSRTWGTCQVIGAAGAASSATQADTATYVAAAGTFAE